MRHVGNNRLNKIPDHVTRHCPEERCFDGIKYQISVWLHELTFLPNKYLCVVDRLINRLTDRVTGQVNNWLADWQIYYKLTDLLDV